MRLLSGAVFLVAPLVALLPGRVLGQGSRFTFEVRGGASIPVGAFADDGRGWERDAGSGPSFGMAFVAPLRGRLSVHAGFSQNRFGCAPEVCGPGEEFVATGFDLGGVLVGRRGRARPWLRATLASYRVEAVLVGEGEEAGGAESVPMISDRRSGWEAGAGFVLFLREHFGISPGVRYGRIAPPFPGVGALEMRYLIADVGVVLGF